MGQEGLTLSLFFAVAHLGTQPALYAASLASMDCSQAIEASAAGGELGARSCGSDFSTYSEYSSDSWSTECAFSQSGCLMSHRGDHVDLNLTKL